jgi:hypothetical protein
MFGTDYLGQRISSIKANAPSAAMEAGRPRIRVVLKEDLR